MRSILKQALSLANKNGKKFIKHWLLGTGCSLIGIEDVDRAHSWFLLVYEYYDRNVRKVACASISTWWSGGAASTFYGDLPHVAMMHAEDRMLRLFGSRRAHYMTGSYQCLKAKSIELNRKYHYTKYLW